MLEGSCTQFWEEPAWPGGKATSYFIVIIIIMILLFVGASVPKLSSFAPRTPERSEQVAECNQRGIIFIRI